MKRLSFTNRAFARAVALEWSLLASCLSLPIEQLCDFFLTQGLNNLQQYSVNQATLPRCQNPTEEAVLQMFYRTRHGKFCLPHLNAFDPLCLCLLTQSKLRETLLPAKNDPCTHEEALNALLQERKWHVQQKLIAPLFVHQALCDTDWVQLSEQIWQVIEAFQSRFYLVQYHQLALEPLTAPLKECVQHPDLMDFWHKIVNRFAYSFKSHWRVSHQRLAQIQRKSERNEPMLAKEVYLNASQHICQSEANKLVLSFVLHRIAPAIEFKQPIDYWHNRTAFKLIELYFKA